MRIKLPQISNPLAGFALTPFARLRAAVKAAETAAVTATMFSVRAHECATEVHAAGRETREALAAAEEAQTEAQTAATQAEASASEASDSATQAEEHAEGVSGSADDAKSSAFDAEYAISASEGNKSECLDLSYDCYNAAVALGRCGEAIVKALQAAPSPVPAPATEALAEAVEAIIRAIDDAGIMGLSDWRQRDAADLAKAQTERAEKAEAKGDAHELARTEAGHEGAAFPPPAE